MWWALRGYMGFPGDSAGKESACSVGDLGSMHELGRSHRKGNGYPLQYSDLENSMDCTAYGVSKESNTTERLSLSLWGSVVMCVAQGLLGGPTAQQRKPDCKMRWADGLVDSCFPRRPGGGPFLLAGEMVVDRGELVMIWTSEESWGSKRDTEKSVWSRQRVEVKNQGSGWS